MPTDHILSATSLCFWNNPRAGDPTNQPTGQLCQYLTSLGEEIHPNILPEPALEQLEAITSHLITVM